MAENAGDEPHDGVIITERARFKNLIDILFNEIDELHKEGYQIERNPQEEVIDNDGMKEDSFVMEQLYSNENEEERTNVEKEVCDDYAEDKIKKSDQDEAEAHHDDTAMDATSNSLSGCEILANFSESEDTSSVSEDAHEQNEASSEEKQLRDINSTVHDLTENVNEMKEKISLITNRLNEIEWEKHTRIGHCSRMFEENYRSTFESLNRNIAIALEHAREADLRLKEANEKCRMSYGNLQKLQFDFGNMRCQLNAVLAEAQKLNLLMIHGKLQLERREAALNSQEDAQVQEFNKARKEKQDIIAALDAQYEAAKAKKRLLAENISADEKEELLEKVKGDKEFEQIYSKHEEIKQKQREIKEVINSQVTQIEHLKKEESEVDEVIRKRKKIGKWKRRFLALLCVKFNDDDN